MKKGQKEGRSLSPKWWLKIQQHSYKVAGDLNHFSWRTFSWENKRSTVYHFFNGTFMSLERWECPNDPFRQVSLPRMFSIIREILRTLLKNGHLLEFSHKETYKDKNWEIKTRWKSRRTYKEKFLEFII